MRALADQIRETERCRLAALVSGDLETAGRLHADDFQLVSPLGATFSKQEYLGAIASGVLKYDVWEPGSIDVRLFGDAAAIRYRARLANTWAGQSFPVRDFWHTDCYEKRDGQWQVVWSQATEIVTPS
ncbi:MAG TPA: nuclear transport factor 2 family protein [Caulobacteraceae bacterium]